MSHLDDDDLSMIAVGESVSAGQEEHLQQCARCRSRLDQLTAVVATARMITDEDRPVLPPDHVWSGILSDLGMDDADADGEVISMSRRRPARSPRWWLVAAAAVAGLVAGSLVTAAVVDFSSEQASLVASATLEPVAEVDVTGTAVIEDAAGSASLRISVPDLPDVPDGYYEVWMATADAGTMVALGTLNPGAETVLPLPAGMQVADFPLVDVSVEHFDGNPGHSAVSVVRGLLPA